MTSFELIDNPLDDNESGEPDTYMDMCACPDRGNSQPVLLAIDAGSPSITCATCRRSLPFLDDLDGVSSVEIPMVLTYHDTTVHYPEPEYDGYWQLTLPEVAQ